MAYPIGFAAGGALFLAAALAGQASAQRASSGVDAVVAARLLAAHNAERRVSRLPELVWDDALAKAAASYAREMAVTEDWRHSAEEARVDQGENLWMGTRDSYTPEEMVHDWIVEKRSFRAGRFPYVSTTGNPGDVGHYTQVIWPQTRRVGCAIASSAQWDYLVCRYTEPGNVYGQNIASVAPAEGADAAIARADPVPPPRPASARALAFRDAR